MMNFDNPEVAQEFELVFGKPVNQITQAQMQWLIKVIKHCRGRCRSNVALANYVKRNFGIDIKS